MKTRFTYFAPILLAAAGVMFADVTTDYNHRIDFSGYHTYSWIGVKSGNPLWQDRIMRAVDSALAAKGWTRVDSGGDVAVSALGKVTEQENLQTFYEGFPGWGWGGWGGDMGWSTTQPEEYKVGTLIVDMFDRNSKQLIWRGSASDTLTSKPEKNDKKLNHSVEEMFKDFPPHPKH